MNEKIEAFIMEQLKNEKYLIDYKHGKTISSLVKRYIMPLFEIDKYLMDFRDRSRTWVYPLHGLRASNDNERLTRDHF